MPNERNIANTANLTVSTVLRDVKYMISQERGATSVRLLGSICPLLHAAPGVLPGAASTADCDRATWNYADSQVSAAILAHENAVENGSPVADNIAVSQRVSEAIDSLRMLAASSDKAEAVANKHRSLTPEERQAAEAAGRELQERTGALASLARIAASFRAGVPSPMPAGIVTAPASGVMRERQRPARFSRPVAAPPVPEAPSPRVAARLDVLSRLGARVAEVA